MTENALNITTTGIPVFNSVTGTFSYVDLTSKGDTLSHTGVAYTAVSVGADDTILKANSAAAGGLSWSSISFTGDRIMLSSQSISNASSVEFTGFDFTTYGTLRLHLVSLHPATDAVAFQLQFTTDNGTSWITSGYKWCYRIVNDSGTASENHSASDSSIEICTNVGNAAGEGISGWLWIFPSDNPTNEFRNSVEWQIAEQSSSTQLIGQWGAGWIDTGSAINGIKIKCSTGNIEAGQIFLYGYKAS